MKVILLSVITMFLSACADSHQLLRTNEGNTNLDPAGVVFVSVPKDGVYGDIDYHGSGKTTTQIVVMAFSLYANRVEGAHEYTDYEKSLKMADKLGAKYLVFPTILKWEDRATEWSAIPDRASIKISVVDVETKKTLDSVVIKGKSGLATFGGDRPQDLLPEPVKQYVKSIY